MLMSTVPVGFSESQVASGLNNPMSMQFAPDGRLFYSEQAGSLRVISKDGVLSSTPFMTLDVASTGERGLMGFCFDPDFANNHFIYCYYTAKTPTIHNRISRFTANGDVVVPLSEKVLYDLDTLTSEFHNGGALNVGKDGKLYLTTGDNLDDATTSQSMTSTNGKVIRINTDGTIPTDNPFYNTNTGKYKAIWARGLRNPYTSAIQPGTGRFFIDDVGEWTWEEVNDGVAGANYGWPNSEGPTTNQNYKTPIYSYDHTEGCAVTAGTFYAPQTMQFPADYANDYFLADFCNGWVRRFDVSNPSQAIPFATGLLSPIDFKVSSDGSLYYLSRDTGNGLGAIYKFQYTAIAAPKITQQPTDQVVAPGQSASFTVAATGLQPISYQWQRNGVDIAGATSATYTIPNTTTLDSGAKFRAKVTGPSAYGVLQDGASWTTGQSGSAVNFDGTNDYLGTSFDLNSILGGTSSLTFWIKTTQVGNNTMWQAPGISGVESAGNSNDVFWGWIDGTGRIGLQAGDTAGAKSTNPINNNAWHNIALTRDASNGQVKVYVDGSLNSTATSGTGVKTTPFASLGRIEDTGGTPAFFKGQLDEVRAYNRVLTASEIAAINSPPTSGLQSYWKFNENAGTQTIDSASTGLSVTSNEALLTVAAGSGPTATINLPAANTFFNAGDTINFSGSATDPDETLGASAFTWRVDFQHDDHAHPFVPNTTGITSGSFTTMTVGETSPNVWYRIYLTVKDSTGLTSTVFRDVFPNKVKLTIQTTPSGIPLTLDAQPISTPTTFDAVVGLRRTLEAPSPVTVGSNTYEFVSWSDGGAAKHDIFTPTSNTTYTATYKLVQPTQVYVSDLTPNTGATNGWGPYEKDKSNGEDLANDGKTITLNGVTYTKGLGVHASSDIRYNIAGAGWTRFQSDVGVDDEVGSNGSLIFRVFADSVKIYDSGTMTGNTATKKIDVALPGTIGVLRLVVVSSNASIDYDHGDWAGAKLIR
jgi:glucose/arabinose dehydrogenase